MSDEAPFLRAITEAPTDDTSRLVYADWLDEHDEPHKAAFLRAECEWAAEPVPAELRCEWGKLPPEHERYPLALRRLTDLMGTIPVDWFAAVSRVGCEMRTLAEQFAARVPVQWPGAGVASFSDSGHWTAVDRMRRELVSHVGADVVNERFEVPVDYAAFALVIGGMEFPDDFWWSFEKLWRLPDVAERTESFCETHALMHTPGDLAACGLWLLVGFRNMDFFHLCCDRASPLFGALVNLEDSHPWMWPPHGPSPREVETRCFLDFLRCQVARAERDPPNG